MNFEEIHVKYNMVPMTAADQNVNDHTPRAWMPGSLSFEPPGGLFTEKASSHTVHTVPLEMDIIGFHLLA